MKRTHKEKITSVLALCAGAGLFIWFCIPLFWGVFHLVCPLAQPYGAGKTCKTPARPAAILLGHLSGVLRLGSFFDRLHAVAHAFALRQRDGCYFRLQGGQRGVAGAH